MELTSRDNTLKKGGDGVYSLSNYKGINSSAVFLLKVNMKRRNTVKCRTRNLPAEGELEKEKLSQIAVLGEVRVLDWILAGRIDVRKGRITAWRC